ncbi:NIPSNAP family protein [Agrobacterium sp. T29]|uniref:NIPSNAP family protein n=1 Tax=Agrobacterium sp. T29 TaxID=2580515 RepID=UPI00115EF5EB|nr:NIPSNAP family protein [Agrobacterium sp. T29]
MIYDHRTYTVAHGKMKEYLHRYETIALPISLRHLGPLVGFWTSEIGPLNQVIHIWQYDSMQDREDRRARMYADPEWQEFLKLNAGTFVQQEVKILKPAAFHRPVAAV